MGPCDGGGVMSVEGDIVKEEICLTICTVACDMFEALFFIFNVIFYNRDVSRLVGDVQTT